MPALARVISMSLWRSVRTPPPLRLEETRAVIAKAEKLVFGDEGACYVEKVKEACAPISNVVPIRPPTLPPPPPPSQPILKTFVEEENEERPSAWEPEPATAIVTVARAHAARRPRRDEALVLQEIIGARSLLLEIVRRSIYDWVLYKTSRRLNYRMLADQAFQWLFVEREGSKDWQQRTREGKSVTSFAAICDALDLNIEEVRTRARCLTPKSVMSIGRPAERRRADAFNTSHGDEGAYALPAGMAPEENADNDETIY